jgi:hypothetical protein
MCSLSIILWQKKKKVCCWDLQEMTVPTQRLTIDMKDKDISDAQLPRNESHTILKQ